MTKDRANRSRSIESLARRVQDLQSSIDRRMREVIRRQLLGELKLDKVAKNQELLLNKVDKVLLKSSGYDVEIAALSLGMRRLERVVLKDD